MLLFCLRYTKIVIPIVTSICIRLCHIIASKLNTRNRKISINKVYYIVLCHINVTLPKLLLFNKLHSSSILPNAATCVNNWAIRRTRKCLPSNATICDITYCVSKLFQWRREICNIILCERKINSKVYQIT